MNKDFDKIIEYALINDEIANKMRKNIRNVVEKKCNIDIMMDGFDRAINFVLKNEN